MTSFIKINRRRPKILKQSRRKKLKTKKIMNSIKSYIIQKVCFVITDLQTIVNFKTKLSTKVVLTLACLQPNICKGNFIAKIQDKKIINHSNNF